LDIVIELLCAAFQLSLLTCLLFRCPKAIGSTQTRTFVKEHLFTQTHGQIMCHKKICHRKFTRVHEALELCLSPFMNIIVFVRNAMSH